MIHLPHPTLAAMAMALAITLAATGPAAAQYRPAVTVLKDFMTLEVAADGTAVRRHESARRIETVGAVESYGQARLPFFETMGSVEVEQAWTITPDGRRIDVAPDQIRVVSAADSEQSVGDEMNKVIIFPAVAPGAVLHYRARFIDRVLPFPGHYTASRFMSPHFVYEDVRWRVEHDPRVPLNFSAKGFVEVQAGEPSGKPAGWLAREFRFRQDQAHPFESGQVDFEDFAPHVLASTFTSHAQFAQLYHTRALPRTVASEAVALKARELTAGLDSPRQKVAAVHQWVSRQIRYVDSSIGVGGWIPRPAAEVLQTRWGDCKDHAALMESMLRAVGIESSAALINSGEAYRLPALPVSTPLNHVILYVPSLQLFLDSTAEFAAPGVLPTGVAGKPALIAATGQVIQTPASHAQRDTVHSRTTLSLKPDGRIQGESEATMRGIYEYRSRVSQFSYRDREESTVVDRLLARFQETGRGTLSTPDPHDHAAPWTVKARFVLDPTVNVPGPSAFAVPVGLTPGTLRRMQAHRPRVDRRQPALCSSSHVLEETQIEFPGSVAIGRLPQAVSYDRGGMRYSSRYERQGQTVKVRRELRIEREQPVCDAQHDRAWADFLPVLQRDLRGQIFLR